MNARPASGIRRLFADFIELIELQFRLLAIDSKEATRRALFSALLVLLAATTAIAALTTGLIGLAWVLHEFADWSVGVSLLVIAAVAIAVMLGMLVAAYASLRRAAAAMKESGAEFAENVRWFRETLRTDDHDLDAAYSAGITGSPDRGRF